MIYENERAEAERIEDAAKEARGEFAWSVRTSRLIAGALRNWATGEEFKDIKTTKAEAYEFIENAESHCLKWLSRRMEAGDFGEAEEKAARESIERIKAEVTKQAEALEA